MYTYMRVCVRVFSYDFCLNKYTYNRGYRNHFSDYYNILLIYYTIGHLDIGKCY